ncbi:hypothetical protein AB1Y20_004710 [Prymnesium parvum]|uniref:4'-phosphopantetheinyl transferase n=1 Tax=Prymnesium parvum TaxID=97485 RepID=A0AB34IZW4_PRYPA
MHASRSRSILLLAVASRAATAFSPRGLRERKPNGRRAPPFPTAFQTATPFGTCVAVTLPPLPHPHAALLAEQSLELEAQLAEAELHADEARHMRSLPLAQRVLFAGSRVAMRRARHGLARALPVLPDALGAPAMPAGWHGSISHTQGLAAALACGRAAREGGGRRRRGIGIDVESTSRSISPRVPRRCLAADERESLGRVNHLDARADALLRFSLKEALYKATHPLVRASIPWHSVTVWPAADGGCRVDASTLEKSLQVRLQLEAQWEEREGFFVSTAAVELLELPERTPS